jgi:hypothetical protein
MATKTARARQHLAAATSKCKQEPPLSLHWQFASAVPNHFIGLRCTLTHCATKPHADGAVPARVKSPASLTASQRSTRLDPPDRPNKGTGAHAALITRGYRALGDIVASNVDRTHIATPGMSPAQV